MFPFRKKKKLSNFFVSKDHIVKAWQFSDDNYYLKGVPEFIRNIDSIHIYDRHQDHHMFCEIEYPANTPPNTSDKPCKVPVYQGEWIIIYGNNIIDKMSNSAFHQFYQSI